jgi:hypothetical protein
LVGQLSWSQKNRRTRKRIRTAWPLIAASAKLR